MRLQRITTDLEFVGFIYQSLDAEVSSVRLNSNI